MADSIEKKEKKSLSSKVVRITVTVSLLVGLVFSSVQVIFDFSKQDDILDAQIHRIIEVSLQAAIPAARRLDEKLAAGIMAHTAQVHLDETLKIAKSGSPEERRSGFSDQMRMASTSRKIGEVDDIGSKPLMMPKAEIIKRNNKETLVVHSKQTQIDNILTRMEQERLIRKVKNKYEQQIDSLIMAQPKDDPQGLTTRLKVAKLVEETYGEKIVVPKSDSAAFENLQHDSYLHHYKLYWALAGKLIKGLDKPSEKGAE